MFKTGLASQLLKFCGRGWSIYVTFYVDTFIYSCLNSSPPEKMAAIWQTLFSDAFFFNANICILIKMLMKLVPKGPVNNNPALVKIMAWHRITIIWTSADPIHWRIYAAQGRRGGGDIGLIPEKVLFTSA